jgi:hypothetical protein
MKALSQILKETSEQKTKKERIAYLKKNTNPALNKLLRYTYGKDMKFLLPEGAPPFKPSKFDEPNALYQEVRRLYLFVEGGQQGLTQLRRESLFIETLEFVDKEDAELLISIKDKKLPYKNLNEDVVREALPEVFSDEKV